MCHRSGSALSVGSEPFLLPLRARIISPLGLVWPLDRRLPTSHASCVCTINPGCVHFCVCVCVRSLQHVEQMRATATMKPRDLHRLGNEFNSIYINNQSFQSALLAAGGCFSAVEQILAGQVARTLHVRATANTPQWCNGCAVRPGEERRGRCSASGSPRREGPSLRLLFLQHGRSRRPPRPEAVPRRTAASPHLGLGRSPRQRDTAHV